ncbi:ABC transporter substrate-binding protein [uncultured Clostridium sp.]|uniref:siderophore ABC transporter substrate-binding protein n=1 Tax=uncultured Clostridium sp. TaxID=59620 RepID=UPI0026319B75|nr:ABC transporter substrate-binding protein [uncultured Clostridium sp.]
MNKKIGIIAGGAVAVLFGGALLFSNKEKEDKEEKTKAVVKIEHEVGTTEVNEEPKRIVVFDFAALDTLDKLGIEGIVGIPKSSTIPEYLSKYKSDEYESVGGLKEPDLEKINELKPDLIIINGRQHSFYEKLSQIAPTISLAKKDGEYIESTTKNLKYLGDIFNKEDEISEELKKINEKVEDINKKVKENGYSATTIMASNGELSVFGKESRFGVIYNELGFENTDENVKAADHGQTVSYEYIKNQKADYMFVIDKGAITNDKKTAKELLNNELVNSSEVYKKGNIIYLNTVAWYISDGGIQSTYIMLDEINKSINKS